MLTMSNERYDMLQRIIRVIIPLITLLTSIGEIWGLPWMGLVTATIAAIHVFLGQVLTASSKKYKAAKFPDAELVEDEDGEEDQEEN